MHPTGFTKLPKQLHRSGCGRGHGRGHGLRIRGVLCAVALTLVSTVALAQAPAADPPQPVRGERIQEQMTAAQFQAAGLDQLTPQQLANLNAWLNQRLQVQTSQAAATAVAQTREAERVEEQDQGFFDGGFFDRGSDEAIVSHIVGTFDGFAEGREYTLDNGQVWVQTNSADLDGVTLTHPEVTIQPGFFGVWYLTVGDYNTRAKVKRVK